VGEVGGEKGYDWHVYSLRGWVACFRVFGALRLSIHHYGPYGMTAAAAHLSNAVCALAPDGRLWMAYITVLPSTLPHTT
jgi:hypothetical protein